MRRGLSQREILFLSLSALLGAIAGYEVGLRIGVAVASRSGTLLVPGHSLWPAAGLGALVGVLVIVPLMWRLRGVDAPAVTEQGARSQPEPSSVVPVPSIPPAGGGPERSGKAPPGTYVVACFRGGLLGAVLGVAVAAIGVIVSIGTEDKWFEMFLLVYVQVGAGIGLVLGGIVEPLRVRLRRARAAER